MSRRFDEVLAQHQKTSELDPDFFYFESSAGIAYREKRMFAESVAEYQHLQKATGQPMAGLAVTYARMGKTSEARGDDAKSFEVRMEVGVDHKAKWIVTDAQESIESQVLDLLKMDMSIREVADELKIPKSTVHRIKTKGRIVPMEKASTW